MRVSVTEAKAQLTDLVKRAEEGEEIILTRHGHPVARIAAVRPAQTYEEKMRVFEEIRASVANKSTPGVSAARSADFLYGDDGLPK